MSTLPQITIDGTCLGGDRSQIVYLLNQYDATGIDQDKLCARIITSYTVGEHARLTTAQQHVKLIKLFMFICDRNV